MPLGECWALRCLLTGLYVFGGVAAGASLAANLVQWAQDLNCLPPITSSFGDPMSVNNALGSACDVIIYGSGVVCGLCLMLAVCLNCCWGHWGWSLFHQTLTFLMCTLSVICGTALTVDFVLWCHTLKNTVGESSCESAASLYDQRHRTSNMTAYFRKMEIQQACQWAVVPFLLCATVLLSGVMKFSATQPPFERRLPTSGRFSILVDEESAPLLSAPLLVSEALPVRAGTAWVNGPPGSHASSC